MVIGEVVLAATSDRNRTDDSQSETGSIPTVTIYVSSVTDIQQDEEDNSILFICITA